MPRARHPVINCENFMAVCLGWCVLFGASCPVLAEPSTSADANPASAETGQEAHSQPTAATDTVYVSASPLAGRHLEPTPALVTVVQLEHERGGADLAELLSRSAGLRIRRYGGLGAQAVPSVRGSSAAQVVVMVDGIPLADAQDGSLDLSNLPVERFARAEVYRGQLPARFGGLGGAGAINLISRADGAEGASLRGFTGSFGDMGGRLLGGKHSDDGRWAGSLLVHGRRIDNQYRFSDHRQTLYTPEDDVERIRWNSHFEEWGGHAGGRYTGAVQTTLSGGVFHRTGGRPGPLGFESPSAQVTTTLADGRLSLSSRRQVWRVDVMTTRAWERLLDPVGEVGFDPPGTTVGVSSDLLGRFTLASPRPLAARRPQRFTWQVGADWRRQWYNQTLNGQPDPQRVRTTATAFAGLVLSSHGTRLAVAPTLRWQVAVDDFPPLPGLPWLPEEVLSLPNRYTAWAPALSLSWGVIPGHLSLQGRGSRTQRLPTWVELFGHRGGIAGNRELLPEEITALDLGLRWQTAGGHLGQRLTFFHNWTDQTIVFVQNSQRTSQAQNIGASQVSGLEWEATARLPGGGDLTAHLTWQRARDRGLDPIYHDRQLPFVPPLSVAFQMRRPWRAWQISTEVIHEAANYRDRYNIELDRAPPRTILNLALGHTLRTGPGGTGRATTITAELINLTDNVVYDVEGYPLPGRSLRLSVYFR